MNNIPKIKSTNNFSLGSLLSSREIVNPKRDWNILLAIFFVSVVASIVFDGYMYKEIVSGDMYISVKRDELVIEYLKTNDLQKILDNFDSKKTNMASLKIENLVDPSI